MATVITVAPRFLAGSPALRSQGLGETHTQELALKNGVIGLLGVKQGSRTAKPQGRSHSVAVRAAAAEGGAEGEPAWKKKLELADQHAEATRAATAAAKAEYERRQAAARRAGRGAAPVTPLAELPLVPFLTEEGKIADCSQADAKASVYAIFDEEKVVRHVGISRAIGPSLRLHFARVPLQCWAVKVQHIKAPRRSALEAIRDAWIAELGYRPTGNDNGPEQNRWENPLDVRPLMTDDEKAAVEEAAPGPPTAKALKQVARRVEAELKASYAARQSTESLRFDPKLKEKGMLDVKNPAPPPDTKVPEKPKQAVKA
ncbi:hypothetical protein KFL_004890080 [Klebsormidium nitens]|uniref:Uncharacterized protein n=1 Tax=Klebsormidium nitens TaxID=105231 RepID=A0A1Y1IDT5_KLENI|nr:hypothetical protein KFL_004890080 [Klebsormidium nitens]|eukprot:GAQ89125.1 hypothetical protein KFL_004890080 [Klebsormidium nitens]